MAEILTGALGEFETLQTDQRQDLRTGKIEGIAEWRQNRGRVFALLQKYFAQVQENADRLDPDFIEALLGRLKTLLAGEVSLEQQVGEAQKNISARLAAIRKGKATLSKYSVHGAVPRPRFLSSRT